MKNRQPNRSRSFRGAFRSVLLLLSLLMAVGMLLGHLVCRMLLDAEDHQLNIYILQYAQLFAEAEEEKTSFFSVLLVYFRYPVLIFLGGCTALSAMFVPLLCAMQGFFLAFSVSCFAAQLGRTGILLALCAFGLRCIIVLPCTLVIAVWTIIRKRELREKSAEKRMQNRAAIDSPCLVQVLGSLMLLAVGAALELWLAPNWLALAITKLL